MTGLFRAIADTIAPPDLTCAVCGGERDVLRGFGVCRACAKTLRPLNETVCVAPNVEAISAFVYEENAAKLVHDLKYGAKGHAAYVLGAFMAARCEDLKRSDFVVVPVSMHPRRYLSRNRSILRGRSRRGFLFPSAARFARRATRRIKRDWTQKAEMKILQTAGA